MSKIKLVVHIIRESDLIIKIKCSQFISASRFELQRCSAKKERRVDKLDEERYVKLKNVKT